MIWKNLPRYILSRKSKLQNKAYKIIPFCFKDTKAKTKTKTQKLCISTDIGFKCSKYIQNEKKKKTLVVVSGEGT